MQEPFTRDRIIEALQAMPPNATIDDAIERLVFLAKVETGLAELDGSEGIPIRPNSTLGCDEAGRKLNFRWTLRAPALQ